MRRAMVCGSGVAGLGAAIALAMRGWAVDIFERDLAIRAVGGGIFLKANGLRVLADYQVLGEIRQESTILQEAYTLDKDGAVLQHRILSQTTPVWNIQRQKLIGALLERATELGARLHTDKALESLRSD